MKGVIVLTVVIVVILPNSFKKMLKIHEILKIHVQDVMLLGKQLIMFSKETVH